LNNTKEVWKRTREAGIPLVRHLLEVLLCYFCRSCISNTLSCQATQYKMVVQCVQLFFYYASATAYLLDAVVWPSSNSARFTSCESSITP
jgi:hypothetical protein